MIGARTRQFIAWFTTRETLLSLHGSRVSFSVACNLDERPHGVLGCLRVEKKILPLLVVDLGNAIAVL